MGGGGGAGEISAVDGSCLLYIVFLPPGCIFSDFFVCMNFSALPDLSPCLMVRPLESIVRISVRMHTGLLRRRQSDCFS